VKRGGLWAKPMGLKGGAIGNTLRGTHWELKEHIENLMETNWELVGNMLGTKEKTRSWTESNSTPHSLVLNNNRQASGNATHN